MSAEVGDNITILIAGSTIPGRLIGRHADGSVTVEYTVPGYTPVRCRAECSIVYMPLKLKALV